MRPSGLGPLPLAGLLRTVRSRGRAQLALDVGVAAVAWGLVAWALASLPGAVVLIWAVVGAAAGVAWVVRRARRLADQPLARWIEQRQGWQERLSTALEVAPASSSMARALHADLAGVTATTRAREVAPYRWPVRSLIAVAFAGVAAFGIDALEARWAATVVQEVRLPPGIVGFPASDGEGRHLADVVERLAELRQDDYLQAIAEALRQASEPAASADERASRAEQGAQALQHLERALGTSLRGAELAERLLSDEFAAQLDREASGAIDDYLAAGQEELPSRPELSSPEAPVSEPQAASNSPAEPGAAVASADAPSAAPPPGEPAEDGPMAASGLAFGGDEDEAAGGSPFAGAAQSGVGDSSMAGRGSQGLEGDPSALANAERTTETVLVASNQRDDGRRIEVHVPPQVGGVADVAATPVTVGAWSPSDEAAMDRAPIEQRNRALVGRYLEPSHALRGRARP